MSHRYSRRGQIKGDSKARFDREKDLSQKRLLVHGKIVRTQPRNYRYEGLPDIGPYTGSYLRRLRALRGVGPVKLLKPFRTVVKYAYGDRDRG